MGFQINIVTNLKEVNVFDVTFNLRNGTFRRYKLPINKLLYIDSSSNYPPQIIK